MNIQTYLSQAQCATMAGVSKSTIINYCKRGKFPKSCRVLAGAPHRYLQQDIAEWLGYVNAGDIDGWCAKHKPAVAA